MDLIFHKYFVGSKMRGNIDESFFESINEVLICLVETVMR